MIKPGEVQQTANVIGVRDQQIEKDYILSWILFGISKQEHLSKAIVFKGGTVLKKVYFEDYRFSEDLDFTLLNGEVSNEQIFEWFKEVFEIIKEEANIPLEIIDNNEHKDGGINFYISYIGPLGGKELNPADFPKKLTERLPQYKGRWQSSMSEQIQDLPDFDQVVREVQRHLKKLDIK